MAPAQRGVVCKCAATGSVKAAPSNSRPPLANQGSLAGSSQAKYLRYVRSKLSKSRLNSVLSLGGGSSSSACGRSTEEPAASADERPPPAAAAAAAAAEGHHQVLLERQQHLVSTSANVDLVAGQVHQLSLHRPVGSSLSGLLLTGDSERLGAAHSGSLKQAKRQNFFQGFRYTLRRRGSKQVAALAPEPASPQLEEAASLQQSQSLTGLSSQSRSSQVGAHLEEATCVSLIRNHSSTTTTTCTTTTSTTTTTTNTTSKK